MATFSGLSLNNAGTGYTLVATSGTLPQVTSAATATSAPFNVAVSTTTTLDSFEPPIKYLYTSVAGPTSAVPVTVAAHDGTYGLDMSGGNGWVYRNDAAAQVKQGDTLSVWLKFAGLPSGRAYFAFGATQAGALSLVAAPNSNQLMLQSNLGFGFANLATISQSYQANYWYRLEVDWSTSGAIVGKLFKSDGVTQLNSVTATATAITSGGFGFRYTGGFNAYFDTVTDTSGVNTFVSRASTGGSTTTSTGTGALPVPSLPAGGGFGVYGGPLGGLMQQEAAAALFAAYSQSGATTTDGETDATTCQGPSAAGVSAVFASLGALRFWGW